MYQSRHHGCHGNGQIVLGRTLAYNEACHRDEGRRQTGYRSPTDQLDGATLLLAPPQVPCATRRYDASRSVAKHQLQRRACPVLLGNKFQERGCCIDKVRSATGSKLLLGKMGHATTIDQNVNPEGASEEKAQDAATQERWYVDRSLGERTRTNDWVAPR